MLTGRVFSYLKQWDKAIDRFEQSLSLHDKFGEQLNIPRSYIHSDLADALKGRGSYDRACEHYEAYLEWIAEHIGPGGILDAAIAHVKSVYIDMQRLPRLEAWLLEHQSSK